MRRLLALVLAMMLVVSGCSAGQAGSSQPDVPSSAPSQEGSALPPEQETEPTVAHLMVAGDIMSHMPITNDAYIKSEDRYDYGHILQEAAGQLALADYAVANLETVLAGGPKYSGFPTFNSPDALAYDVKKAGFDLLSTVNNHSRDQGVDGLFRTLDVLDEAGLAHVGTYRSQAERDENSGIYVADVGGISVAFLAYTYGLNGFRLDSDRMYAANLFNLDYYTTLNTPNYELLESDLAAARELDTDLIAVMMHWGVEYQTAENRYQEELAQFLVGQGADLILGGHPHVLQPYERVTAAGPDGERREGFVIYSLGNFISNQNFDDNARRDLATRTTVILDLELTQDPVAGETTLTDVRYTPYYMVHRDRAEAGDRRYLVNVREAMADYEAGETGQINEKTYGQLQKALELCHEILGEEGDRPSV